MKRKLIIGVSIAALVLLGFSGTSFAGGIRKVWVATEPNAKRPAVAVKPKDTLYIMVDLKNPKDLVVTFKVFTPTGVMWKSGDLSVKDGSSWAYKWYSPPRHGFDKGQWRVEAWEGQIRRSTCTFNVR